MLKKQDIKQIEEYGLTLRAIYKQLETFSLGIPPVEVVTAASAGNGIEVIPKKSHSMLLDLFEAKKDALDIVKFVPASGAATRMFRFLHRFLETYDPENETLARYLKRTSDTDIELFFKSIKDFAFVKDVRKKIRKNYPDFKHYKKGKRHYYFVKTMMEPEGLNFSNLPKGLIPFHKYNKFYTTAFEEHLYEAAFYASARGEAYLHFTFSEEHVPFFKKEFTAIEKRVGRNTKTNFHISYSFQKKETDTIAVTMDNKPFREEDGSLIFRPSGHGALLDNLNEIDADLIFIKNIDNVATKEYVETIAYHKRLLAGKLLWLQQKVFNYVEYLNEGKNQHEKISEIRSFLWNELSIKDIPEEPAEMMHILNRPLRVCGVVENTGAPGGGPYWVKDKDGKITLQIIEMAQIDTSNPRQKSLVQEATHFNPVDIVCGIRNYKGEKFDLKEFNDPGFGFISLKSKDGVPLRALELPGLWNGAMAHWNTALIEVPLITFNPVKTVNDLLKKEHRPDV